MHLTELKKAILDRDEQHDRACKAFVDKLTQLQIEASHQKGVLEATTRALDDAKKQVGRTAGEIGSAGETEIEQFLQHAFGGYIIVRNVSKIGQGRQLDLEATTGDLAISIRIDTKAASTTFCARKRSTDLIATLMPSRRRHRSHPIHAPALRGDAAQSNLNALDEEPP